MPLLSSCGHPVQRTLSGYWQGEGVENFADDATAAANGWARGASLEFAGQKLTITIPAEEPRSAPYKVAAVHQHKVRLLVQTAEDRTETLQLILDDEKSARWMLDEERAILLHKE